MAKAKTAPKKASEKAAAPTPRRVAAPPKVVAPPSAAERRIMIEATKSFLDKKMGQKPIEPSTSQLPHIPSGSIVIDNLIGGSMALDGKGRNCPGYPRRRIVEIYGPEASGKTTAALSAIVQCQQAGGVAMFIDMEHALHYGYAKRLGVNFTDLLLYAPETLESCFKLILGGIINGVDLIVVDSVAALIPKAEMEKDLDDAARIGILAVKMSQNLPKFAMWLDKYPINEKGTRKDHQGTCLLLLNQIRAMISTGGPPGRGGGAAEQTPGGKALKFYAYLRLKFQKLQQERVERLDPVSGKKHKYDFGTKTMVRVIKSKIDAKNGHDGTIFIRYGFGIDNFYSLIESGVYHKIIKRNQATFSYKEVHAVGRDKFRALLMENKAVAREIEEQIIAALVADSESSTTAINEEPTEEDIVRSEIEADLSTFDDAKKEDGSSDDESSDSEEDSSDSDDESSEDESSDEGETVVESEDDIVTPDDMEVSE